LKKFAAVLGAAVLALTGCSGEDGAAGADGTSCTITDNGDGTSTISCEDGTTATISDGADGMDGTDGQSCTMTTNPDGTKTVTCPDGGTVILPAETISGQVFVSDQAVTTSGDDVVITFKVAVDGVASTAFTHEVSSYRHAYDPAANSGAGGYVRTSIATDAYTVSVDATGLYTVTIPGLATTVGSTPTTYMIRLDTGVAYPQATVIAHSEAGPSKDVPADQACINCHGLNVFRDALHHGANPQGVGACVVCHVRDRESRGELGDRLKSYVHGIHNSHAMPERTLATDPEVVVKPDGVYAPNDSLDSEDWFSIGFPGYMINCSTCHGTGSNLGLVNAEPVSWSNCMSCHDSWDGFPNTVVGGTLAGFHRSLTETSSCASCHDGSTAPATANGLHNSPNNTAGFTYTDRNGLIWNGVDQSVAEGARLGMSIDSVTVNGANLEVAWSATWDGVAIDPCNGDVAAGPVFYGLSANSTTGQSNSNMTFLRSYALANDWVNDDIGSTSPGQPVGTVTPSSTTCALNVATTVVPAQATGATKGVIALQGKAQITFTLAPTTNTRVIQIRSPNPTREFTVADGSLPADARRKIVDTGKCIACHLGSLYQHGGNRVDNVDLCVLCHNPAANESNVRGLMAVDASEAYDFQPGQTYDLRFMVHAIHSAGETGQPLVYYRTNGIYFFGNAEALAAVPNWPGTGCQVVAGSGPPIGTGNQCDTTNTTQVTKNHNYIEIHYPRALNDCAACHVDGSENSMPMPWVAVAVTEEYAGLSTADQTDDELIGPTTASCMSCHQSGDWFGQAVLRAHAYDNSWNPQVFPNGRQDLIDGVEIETCILCHGPGSVADYSAMHAR
jgi:OmcA/MtrC family decaheme c-type cytochrome